MRSVECSQELQTPPQQPARSLSHWLSKKNQKCCNLEVLGAEFMKLFAKLESGLETLLSKTVVLTHAVVKCCHFGFRGVCHGKPGMLRAWAASSSACLGFEGWRL